MFSNDLFPGFEDLSVFLPVPSCLFGRVEVEICLSDDFFQRFAVQLAVYVAAELEDRVSVFDDDQVLGGMQKCLEHLRLFVASGKHRPELFPQASVPSILRLHSPDVPVDF